MIHQDRGAHEERTALLVRPGFALGHFVCPPHSARWREDNVIADGHVLAFPRQSVEIEQRGRPADVAAPGHVVFYARDQVYRRRLLDPRGDDCYFIGLPASFVEPIVRSYDPNVDDRPGRPFPFSRGTVDPQAFAGLAWLLRRVHNATATDDLELEEHLIALVDRLVGSAYRHHGCARRNPSRAATTERHVALARRLEQIVSCRFNEALSLGDLADQADTSPYHAARVFRRHTGVSLHAYRTRLRLHAAATAMLDRSPRLADLALEVGFSSHSHLCDAFSQHFGFPPSAVRVDSRSVRTQLGRLARAD